VSEKVWSRLKNVRVVAALVLVVYAMFGTSCSIGNDITYFKIAIDSVSVPTTWQIGGNMTVRFWGTIGPDMCWMLNTVDRDRTANSYTITFNGQHVARNDCPKTESTVDYEDVLTPVGGQNNPFTVTVVQPTGPNIVRTVTVQ
jgi:hypothetical protein